MRRESFVRLLKAVAWGVMITAAVALILAGLFELLNLIESFFGFNGSIYFMAIVFFLTVFIFSAWYHYSKPR